MLPHAHELLLAIRAARTERGGLLVGLDFDGTLAPIVRDPADASMTTDARAALQALAARTDTRIAFVSGRALSDIEGRTAIRGAWCVGNHGFEVRGGGIDRIHPAAAAAAPHITRLASQLREQLADVHGVIVENKTFTLSVHYRMIASEADVTRVHETVATAAGALPGLRRAEGRKVIEVRPDVDWDKGTAFQFLRDTLEPQIGTPPALFIGDDVTDEDAFRVLRDDEWPIIVADALERDTLARARLHTPDDVAAFLGALACDG